MTTIIKPTLFVGLSLAVILVYCTLDVVTSINSSKSTALSCDNNPSIMTDPELSKVCNNARVKVAHGYIYLIVLQFGGVMRSIFVSPVVMVYHYIASFHWAMIALGMGGLGGPGVYLLLPYIRQFIEWFVDVINKRNARFPPDEWTASRAMEAGASSSYPLLREVPQPTQTLRTRTRGMYEVA